MAVSRSGLKLAVVITAAALFPVVAAPGAGGDTPGTTITVSPATNLNATGHVVQVSGTGFSTSALVDLYQCHVIQAPPANGAWPTENCAQTPLKTDVQTSATGVLPATSVTVARTFTRIGGGTEDCGAAFSCNIFAVETNKSPARNDHGVITFRKRVPPADFDGDGDTEISVFRPASGVWYTGGSAPSSVVFGANGDIPVPADYDGDGNVDQAVFRPSTGVWYTNGTPAQSVAFGMNGDVPVPADYDGDGKADIAVYRPSNNVWYIRTPASSTPFGTTGDIPVPADYNGDGKAEIAVFRPSNGVWYVTGPPASSTPFGVNGDIPVPGDYDGDGKADVAVFRPSNNVWYIGGSNPTSVPFGAAGDQPQPGDYNGDGKTDIAVFRPSANVWFIQSPPSSTPFGVSGDVPLVLPYAIQRVFF